MTGSVIVAGARPPVAKFSGAYKTLTAVDLGAIAIREAVARAGIEGSDVDYVIMGQVIQAGCGQNPARQALAKAGLPQEVPGITVNKVCLSGMSAVAMADQMIKAGDAEVVIAGGMESMTNAPYLVPSARFGSRLGDTKMVDAMILDGLWTHFSDQHMGDASDDVNAELGITREDQDAWSAKSHQKAHAAWEEGAFVEETFHVEIEQRKGDPIVFQRDDGIRPDTTMETLTKLRPAFQKEGTITAGNASQLSDGSAALVVMSEAAAERLGVKPLAQILAYGISAERYAYLHTVPALAIQNAAKKAEVDVHDLEIIEINEAFAAVALNSTRMLGVDEEKVNPKGGAVAIGHPIGASGARLTISAMYEMRRRDVDLSAAAICGGGGQGDALILKNLR